MAKTPQTPFSWGQCFKELRTRLHIWLTLFYAVSGVVIQVTLPEQWKFIGAILIWLPLALYIVFQTLKSFRIVITPISNPGTFGITREEKLVKGTILGVIALFSILGLLLLVSWPSKSPDASSLIPAQRMSMNCSPESLPIPGKHPDSLFGVFLHPDWGNQVVKHMYGSNVSGWPEKAPFGMGYQCAITNTGTVKLESISVLLRVEFRSEKSGHRGRTIEAVLWTGLDANQQSILHIADDSGWDPKVTLPEFALVRVSGERKRVTVPIEYPTPHGEPIQIAGFGSH